MNPEGREPLAVFGAGWVGLVTAACFAELGHEVSVRDVVPEKVARLQKGEVPFFEPGLGDLLERNRERLTFTLDAAEAAEAAELVFVCVDTPPTYSGDADLSRVWTVIDELPQLDRRSILVMKSTVPVGTGDKVRAALEARGLSHIGYVSNPEFLAEGNAVNDFMDPDRVVVGSFAEADGDRVAALYKSMEAPIVRSDVASAEMIKLAANAFLATRISFINEIANVCEVTGADVVKVAEGVGLDHRLGPHFLRAGVGYGGSCLAGNETVLVRRDGIARLMTLERLFSDLERSGDGGVVRPSGLDVFAWRDDLGAGFYPVAAVTRRGFTGEIVALRTKLGRRIRCTPDHPFVVSDSDGLRVTTKRAEELTSEDWLPLAHDGLPAERTSTARLDVLAGMEPAEAFPRDVIVRAPAVATMTIAAVRAGIAHLGHRRGRERSYDILRSGVLRLDEAHALDVDFDGATFGTARNGTYVPGDIEPDEAFWRVVGLYIAEGHCSTDGRRERLQWSFHPTDEEELVDEVVNFWRARGVRADVRTMTTTRAVSVSSRLLANWWLHVLGLGRNCYQQRIPDLAWTESTENKRALLAGLWRGDGSWSYVAGGPSVVLEYGTVSHELADGILRMLADFDVMAALKVARASESTRDTFWIRVSGADQVERLLDLVSSEDQPTIRRSIARQTKRIAPTGYRRRASASWVRVTDVRTEPFLGDVYSLEVPGADTFVTTGGLVVHNCFPKDTNALKQLASNSGYHFQLLSAVIEVNELQKRRVINKLQKYLGKLRGKRIALLGLAFKSNTDDMREAPSVVLASRLLAEGADVRAYDPVANPGDLVRGVALCETALDAVRDADAAVIVTDWDEFRSLASEEVRDAMRRPLIVDGRNLLDPEATRAAGFDYEGIGRAASPLAALPETPERDTELTE
jgi:UDPglucose 6-dehydrogenase